VDAQTFHVQLVFQVIKTLRHSIFVPVHHERFHRIFDIVSQEHISAPYGCLFYNKEGFISIFMSGESQGNYHQNGLFYYVFMLP